MVLLSSDCRRMAVQHLASTFNICRTSTSANENMCVSRAPGHISYSHIKSASRCINLHIEWSIVKQTVFPTHGNSTTSHKGSVPTINVAGSSERRSQFMVKEQMT